MDAAEATKTEDGKAFRRGDFAYHDGPPGDWKLRLTSTPGGAPDAGHVGAAIAALGKGFRGNKVELPAGAIATVKARVRAAWRQVHPEQSAEEMPDVITASADYFAPGAIHVPRYQGSAPPGWEATVEQLTHDTGIANPFAFAWYLLQRGVVPPTQASQATFDIALSAVKEVVQQYGLPVQAVQAALGDAWAQALILTPDAGFYVHQEGR